MKKIRRCLSLLVMILLFLQLTAEFDQHVFALSEQSSVGIKFEGNVPQPRSSSEKQNDTSNQDLPTSAANEQYPKTNDKNNLGVRSTGLLLALASLGWIRWKNREKGK